MVWVLLCLDSNFLRKSILAGCAKGTLVPECGWKYYILPIKVHPQTSFPEFSPRILPQNSASEFSPRILPQNSAPEFSPRIQPQLSFGSRYLFQGLQPSKPRCLAWAEKRMLQKTCQKNIPLLLTTRSTELKPSALKKNSEKENRPCIRLL